MQVLQTSCSWGLLTCLPGTSTWAAGSTAAGHSSPQSAAGLPAESLGGDVQCAGDVPQGPQSGACWEGFRKPQESPGQCGSVD